MRIDAHQHFWKYNPERDSWITDDMAVIQRDFLPEDLFSLLQRNGIDGCITVQSVQSEEENTFQLLHAEQHDFIKGVVGWVDLQSHAVEDRLAHYSGFKKLKGFRHVLQGEQNRALMLEPAFKRGISLLHQYGFSYDALVLPDQLKYLKELVSSFPNQRFVIDHLAKPPIKSKEIDQWKTDMKKVASHENVYCKISGMVTEADWKNHEQKDFIPYIDAVVALFGTKRIMYGSDWPVCLVAASYEKTLGIVKEYFSTFSQAEQAAFFGGNAATFYKL
jgi:L-fuconolactonase